MFSCDKCDYTTTDRSNFRRHCKRKVPCSGAPKTTHNAPKTTHDAPKTTHFVVTDENRVRCTVCDKQLLKRSMARHSCRGAPINVCLFCKRSFNHSSNLTIHKKRCKQNPTNMVPVPEHQEHQQQTVVQNITNNNNTVNNNVTINIQVNTFTRENIDYLVDRLQNDPVIRNGVLDFGIAYDLIHNNSDHPENQTIRKPVKKDDIIYVRNADDNWDGHPSKTIIPRIKENLERKLNTRFTGEQLLSNKAIREMIWQKSCSGSRHEEDILKPSYLIDLETASSDVQATLHKITFEVLEKLYAKYDDGDDPVVLKNHTAIIHVNICKEFKQNLNHVFLETGLKYQLSPEMKASNVSNFIRFHKPLLEFSASDSGNFINSSRLDNPDPNQFRFQYC